MAYATLTGDYGYKEYWVRGASGTAFNAAAAKWDIAANETAPAINIYDSNGIVINGGEIWGHVSQTGDWGSNYNHMATAFRVSNSANTTIRNVHIDGTWDGIRFIPDDSLKVANGNSNGWLIEDVRMTNIRDDAIENDFAQTGTLRDSLLDGVFSAFGTVNNQSAHGVLTVDDSIIIMKDYLKDGEKVHGSPFKFNTADPQNNPDLTIVNSIIAVQDPTHNGLSRLNEAWDNLTVSSGNYYLNLSDTPFPSNYPLPPSGFTILQGQAARDFLASEKAKWLAEHDGPQTLTDPTPPVLAPDPTPSPASTPGTIWGTNGLDNLFGSERSDQILANAGADYLYGRRGADEPMGGDMDRLVFHGRFDGTIDEILDSNSVVDDIYLDNAVVTRSGSESLSGSTISGTNLEDSAGARAGSIDLLPYDSNSGNLSYGADGSGSGAAIALAHFQPGLDLAAAYVI